jgi:hypothetical protein
MDCVIPVPKFAIAPLRGGNEDAVMLWQDRERERGTSFLHIEGKTAKCAIVTAV